MFIKATKLEFLKGTELEVEFINGEIKRYDMMNLAKKVPIIKNLQNRNLFLNGKLVGNYGIRWNDDIDIDVQTIYEDGVLIATKEIDISKKIGNLVCEARNQNGMTQLDLSKLSKIDQSDISKLERGITNPSINLLARIADALDMKLYIEFKKK